MNYTSNDSYCATVGDLAKDKAYSDVTSNSNDSSMNFVFDSVRRINKLEEPKIK